MQRERRARYRPAQSCQRSRNQTPQQSCVARRVSIACDNSRTKNREALEAYPLNRFVFVMTVLERYTDQECPVLLGCTRRDVVSARTHALQQLAAEAATPYRQQPTASPEMPALHECAVLYFS